MEHNTKGTYTISGSLTNTFCNPDSPYRTVEIGANGTYYHDSAPFSIAGENIIANLSGGEAIVNFDASGSWDDGNIASYEWDFGDETPFESTSQPTVQHTYTVANVYYVTVTVSDDSDKISQNGKASTMTVTVTES